MSREEHKNNRLEYVYQASSELGKLPLLGSIVRALGKGWRVCVVTRDPQQASFDFFAQNLKDASFFTKLRLEEATHTDFSVFDLVLCDGIDHESVQKLRHSPKLLGKTHFMASEDQPTELLAEYDLISAFSQNIFRSTGVTSITGNGKGKTTSALGLAIQTLAQHQVAKVIVIQWFKERKKSGDLTWAINEHQFPSVLIDPTRLEFFPTGLGFYGSPKMDRVKGEHAYQQHRRKAYEGLELARQAITSQKYSLIVLDELIDTVKEIAQNIEFPLIDLQDLQEFLQFCVQQKQTPIVVTGRRVTDDWQKYISRSIVITEVKHPWATHHRGAVSGLDF